MIGVGPISPASRSIEVVTMSETAHKPDDQDESDLYQVMPAMDDDALAGLKEDIRTNGVEDPVHIDEDGDIIDGHHRVAICDELGIEDYPTKVHVGLSEQEKRDLAYKLNLQQRHLERGQKQEVVEQYLIEDWDGVETQKKIAEKLGCSRGLVSQAKGRVNSRLDTLETTVNTNGRTEDGGGEKKSEDNESKVAFSTFSPTGDEKQREKAKQVVEAANEGDEAAQEEAEKVATGRTSIQTASKNVEKKQAKEETERQRSEPDEVPARINEADAIEFINTFDDGEIDLLLTDPPYSSDIDDIREFAESWVPTALEKVASDGHAYICIGEYPEEIAAYYDIISEFEKFDEVQLLAWTYRNTLGRMPNRRYGRGWQAILYLCGEDADDLDVPETKEQFSAMDITAPDGRHGTKHHKWQKPAELFERFVRHSTDESDLVVDPFAGSGTTLLEAASLGRENRGCDADPEAIEAALERGCVSDA